MANGNAGSLKPQGAYRLAEKWNVRPCTQEADCLDSPRDPCQRVLAVGVSSKLTTQNSLSAKIEDCTKCYVR